MNLKANHFYLLLLLSTLFIRCQGAKIVKLVTSSNSSPATFNQEIDFRYVNGHIFIDVEINDSTYNFLFDTGWEITAISNDLRGEIAVKSSVKAKTSGSSFKTHAVNYGYLNRINIGTVNMTNIGVGMQDLDFINKSYPPSEHADGIIGTNVLSLANWQIDYKNRKIRFSTNFDQFNIQGQKDTIKLLPRNKSGWGLKKVQVNLDGYLTPFVFDTGSSGAFTINMNKIGNLGSNLADSIISIEAIAISDSVVQYSTLINELRIDNFALKNEYLSLEEEVSSLIGNKFLENYLVSINWKENFVVLSK